jgi:oligopeptide/dipeptide ABC transporter ATP-binding protein
MGTIARHRAEPPPDASRHAAAAAPGPVLRLAGLCTQFRGRGGLVPAVQDMSFDLHRGETLGLVGESGCGKSATAMSILRLIPPDAGRIVDGAVFYDGRDLLRLSDKAMRAVRGNQIAMIFQEPMTALNPVFTIGFQIAESLRAHLGLTNRQATERAVEMLRLVHIPEAERRLHAYPHELSGGMRQRAMIAIALCCNPAVLIADEPTTALDATIQAQIIELMREIQDRLGTAILMITHDLGVVAETAHRVIVIYAGRKVEEAGVDALFATPRHPYTQGLLRAMPRLGDSRRAPGRRRLHTIDGAVQSPAERAEGCAFAPRCAAASDICRRQVPPFERKAGDHWAACWHAPRVPA